VQDANTCSLGEECREGDAAYSCARQKDGKGGGTRIDSGAERQRGPAHMQAQAMWAGCGRRKVADRDEGSQFGREYDIRPRLRDSIRCSGVGGWSRPRQRNAVSSALGAPCENIWVEDHT
jgi:hypothetical protein